MSDATTIDEVLKPCIDAARRDVMLEAAWELDALAMALPGLVAFTDSQEHLVVRGIAARISTLANAVMAGLHDGGVPTRDIERDVLLRVQEEADQD